MAAVASSATVTIPSFNGVKASVPAKPATAKVKASLKDIGIALAATAAAWLLAGSAMGMEVLMGSEDGSLVFILAEFSVAPGEEIVFKNNARYPHNVFSTRTRCPPA